MPLSWQCVRTNSDAHSHLGVFMFVVCWSKTVCFFITFLITALEVLREKEAAVQWNLRTWEFGVWVATFIFAEINKLLKVNEKGALTPHTVELTEEWELYNLRHLLIMFCRNSTMHNKVYKKCILTSREEISALKNTCSLVSKMLPKDLLTEIKTRKHSELLKWFGFNV